MEQKNFRHGMRYATSAAIDAFREGKEGDQFTRDQMAKIIKESCELGTPGYGSVNVAIRHCETNYLICWRWVKEVQAWRYLTSEEASKVTGQLMRRARTKAKRSLRVSASVEVSKLSEDQRRQHNLSVLSAGLMVTAGSSAFQKKVGSEKTVGPNFDQLSKLVSEVNDPQPKH